MWNVILHILSIMGSILLALLAILLAALLIVLFLPITYRVRGRKYPEEAWITAKANWLFGLARVQFSWPEPGKLLVKLFGKTIFDSGRPKKQEPSEKKKPEENPEEKPETPEEKNGAEEAQPRQDEIVNEKEKGRSAEAKEKADVKTENRSGEPTEGEGAACGAAQGTGTAFGDGSGQTSENAGEQPETPPEDQSEEAESGISAKLSKIKYTIQGICDKIKDILENISYYSGLLQEKNTAELWQHVKLRLGKIWKSVRPRHLKAEVLFGTGSPDTTGYVFGLYGMLSPLLGPEISVTPDFTQAVFRGSADISGHITVAVLLWNGLRVLLDRKLHLFIRKIKRKPGRKNQAEQEIKNGRK